MADFFTAERVLYSCLIPEAPRGFEGSARGFKIKSAKEDESKENEKPLLRPQESLQFTINLNSFPKGIFSPQSEIRKGASSKSEKIEHKNFEGR